MTEPKSQSVNHDEPGGGNPRVSLATRKIEMLSRLLAKVDPGLHYVIIVADIQEAPSEAPESPGRQCFGADMRMMSTLKPYMVLPVLEQMAQDVRKEHPGLVAAPFVTIVAADDPEALATAMSEMAARDAIRDAADVAEEGPKEGETVQ